MSQIETAVRDTAAALHAAIKSAVDAGYRIGWPSSPDGLLSIAVSETAKVKPAAYVAPEAKPAPAPSRFARNVKPETTGL